MRRSQPGKPQCAPSPLLFTLLILSLALNVLLLYQPSKSTPFAATRPGSSNHQSGRDVEGPLCSNTCSKAANGICDEGRGGNLTAGNPASDVNWVYCDLGTDCQDCGPWHGVSHGPTWQELDKAGLAVGPIQYLTELGIQVRVRQTPYEPQMFFAYSDPSVDSDESEQMHKHKIIEPVLSQTAVHILKRVCSRAEPGSAGNVVDVGANFGWYSVLAAALGCCVSAFEPVPTFRAFLEYSSARNHLHSRITVYPHVVASDTRKNYTLAVTTKGQWGATRIGSQQTPGAATSIPVQATAVSLKRVLPANGVIDLLKVDVEGYEPLVMSDAADLIKSKLVRDILFEYSPGYYTPRLHDKGPDMVDALPRMMLDLFDVGYQMAWLPWHVVFRKDHLKQGAGGWDAPLPAMQQVVRKHSEYDLWSMQSMRDKKLPGAKGPDSWPCPEMRATKIAANTDGYGAFWSLWHPKGLQANFQFNTNIWATLRNKNLQPLGSVVGEEYYPLGDYSTQTHWFPKTKAWGTLYSEGCDKPKTAVAARCRCPGEQQVCLKQQAAIEACEKQGLLGYPDL